LISADDDVDDYDDDEDDVHSDEDGGWRVAGKLRARFQGQTLSDTNLRAADLVGGQRAVKGNIMPTVASKGGKRRGGARGR
jgi:hypothetical protein